MYFQRIFTSFLRTLLNPSYLIASLYKSSIFSLVKNLPMHWGFSLRNPHIRAYKLELNSLPTLFRDQSFLLIVYYSIKQAHASIMQLQIWKSIWISKIYLLIFLQLISNTQSKILGFAVMRNCFYATTTQLTISTSPNPFRFRL